MLLTRLFRPLRIGRDEVVASGNGVDHGGGRRRADVQAARCQRKEQFRPARGVTEVLQRDAGPLVIAELVGQFVRVNAASAGEVAQGHGGCRRLSEGSAGTAAASRPPTNSCLRFGEVSEST